MRSRILGETGRGSAILLAVVLAFGIALAGWKTASARATAAAAAHQPEPIEMVTSAVARTEQHRATTTSIGTVLALRSITLRTELSGTVHAVALVPGRVVDSGTVLVALDVSVEQAELEALQAQSRSEEHTSELQSPDHLVCRLLLEKKNKKTMKSTQSALSICSLYNAT